MLIVYFILLMNGWEFVAIQSEDTGGYCESLKVDLDKHNENKLGNMKIVCIEDRGIKL